jgi:uncharacterized protein (TIGR04255 family)
MSIHYQNAPISEALIDIKVHIPNALSLDLLESMHARIKDDYPRSEKRSYLHGQFSMGDAVGAVATQTHIGYAFTSADGKQIVQARLDGFTFSRLKPYGTWLTLRDESRRLWDIYRTLATAARISRIAVRYINQIDIPLKSIDYKDYFRTLPEVSPDLPQSLSGLFMQLQFPQLDLNGMLILTQTAIPAASPDQNSVVLDLDVFAPVLQEISEEALWDLLENLRHRKNEFFEACITDKTRELFGKKEVY